MVAALVFSCPAFASQGVDLFGQHHGVSIYVSKAKGDGRDLVVKMEKPNHILIEAHERPNLFKVEDINNDKVLEIWARSYWGEEFTIDLYQIDLQRMREVSGKAVIIKSSLTIVSGSSDPFKDTIHVKSIDGDGLMELLVKTPTHPFYGTLYSPGEVDWTDIYQLNPLVKLANRKFKQFYLDLSTEIKHEEQRILSRIDELEKAIQNESEDSDLKTIYEIKVREANDQISVYHTWLQKIEKITR